MPETSKGRSKTSAVYRVRQPIENLRVRVRIVQQKSLLAELFENEGETRDSNFLEEEEYEFGWQEVLERGQQGLAYGRIRGYAQNGREHGLLWRQSGDDAEARSWLSMRNERAVAACAPAERRKPLAERYERGVVEQRPTERRVRQNHYLHKEERKLQIAVDLSPRDQAAGQPEALLCTLSYEPLRRRLRVSPDFSTSERCYSVDGSGMSYDFWIEHVSAKPSAHDLASAKALRERRRRAARAAPLPRQPRPRGLRLLLSLDIEAAEGFGEAPLFVSYWLDLPRRWSSERAPVGRTQRCRPSGGVAHFSHCAEMRLDLDDAHGPVRWPSLLLSVASLDAWTRYRIEGYASLTLASSAGSFAYKLQCWRPVGGLIDSLRRFFTGGTRELDDITFCAVPSMRPSVARLDKSNLAVVSSGSIRLRIGAVHHGGQQQLHSGEGASSELLNGVDDVLGQFRAARERMMQAQALRSSTMDPR